MIFLCRITCIHENCSSGQLAHRDGDKKTLVLRIHPSLVCSGPCPWCVCLTFWVSRPVGLNPRVRLQIPIDAFFSNSVCRNYLPLDRSHTTATFWAAAHENRLIASVCATLYNFYCKGAINVAPKIASLVFADYVSPNKKIKAAHKLSFSFGGFPGPFSSAWKSTLGTRISLFAYFCFTLRACDEHLHS